MFKGSIVAIVTPFKEGEVDEEAYRELIEFQIENNTSAIVPCGTTGESATLNIEEHNRVVDIAWSNSFHQKVTHMLGKSLFSVLSV